MKIFRALLMSGMGQLRLMCRSYETGIRSITVVILRSVTGIALLLSSLGISAEEPWSVVREHPVTDELNDTRTTPIVLENNSLSQLIFQFYTRYISPIDGQTCHYLPTCSVYGAQALERYGVFHGIWMITDRLIRCHSGQREHPVDPPLRY